MLKLCSKNGMYSISSISKFQSLVLYSSSSTASKTETHFMVVFLVNSLGFSREEATVTSSKVGSPKSTENPNSVINVFEQSGLNKTQIRNLVRKSPPVLSMKVEKTLKPKIRVFQELGFSGSDLFKLIYRNGKVLEKNLNSTIVPAINTLKSLICSDEVVVSVLKRAPRLLDKNLLKRAQCITDLLKECGLSDEKISKLFISMPTCYLANPSRFKDVINRVEKLGIPCESAAFVEGIKLLYQYSPETIESRFHVFRSFGWNELNINLMFRKCPNVVRVSDTLLMAKLNFLANELGCDQHYLASHPCLFLYNLETRIIPRGAVLQLLREKKTEIRFDIFSVMIKAESDFLRRYVFCYKDEASDLYSVYRSRMNYPMHGADVNEQ